MSSLLDRITINAEQCGGRPCIRGMRIRVSDVLDLYASGLTSEQILQELPDLELENLPGLPPICQPKNQPSRFDRMRIWIDAQLSPAIATWLNEEFRVDATAVRDLDLREATDIEIFEAARHNLAVVMTKDADFVDLLNRMGDPPKIIWITCGNTSNASLKSILSNTLPKGLELLKAGENLVEISDR